VAAGQMMMVVVVMVGKIVCRLQNKFLFLLFPFYMFPINGCHSKYIYSIKVKSKVESRREDISGSGGIAPPFLTSSLDRVE
jgi:hypothetical protein